MPIDLRQINTSQAGANTKGANNSLDVAKENGESKSANNVANQDSVELSSKSQLVSSLLKEISNQPEVNASKVDELRNSIASGEYTVSADKVANKLLTLDFGHRKLS